MEYYLFTNQGTRPHNEDYIGIIERDGRYLFLLADGLGGHGKGEVASKLVVDKAMEYYKNQERIPSLEECIQYSQDELLALQEKEQDTKGMKTTIVALEVSENSSCWAHVGDSRLYAFYKGKMKTRTCDHSVPQMLVVTGKLKESEIRNHPDRNRLLRVMGMPWQRPMYDVAKPYSRKKRQAFLLCSDGFWEWIEEKDMQKMLKKSKTPEQWIENMRTHILAKGAGCSMDNYSAIAVFL